MATVISIEKINEKFNTNYSGEEIGYGEMGAKFREVECDDVDDFYRYVEIGQCSEINGTMYYKIRNSQGDAESFYIDDDGDLITI